MAHSAALSDDATAPLASSHPTRRRLLAALGIGGVAATAATLADAAGTDRSAARAAGADGTSPGPSGGDDTGALQSWLRSGGRRLTFSSGTFRISAGLTIPGGVAVSGDGATLRAAGGAFQMITFGGDDVTLTGLEIDGGGAGGSADPGMAAVFLPGVARGTVRGCSIHDMPAIGISVNGGSTGYLISENTIISCGQQAVSIDHSDGGRVLGNHIERALHGVQWWGGDSAQTSAIGVRDIVVSDNRIATVMGGVWGSLGQNVTVTGNRISDCRDVGVDFEGCQDCVATGNSVHNARHACYAVFYASQRIVFDGNVGVNDSGAGHGSGFMAYRQPASQSIQVSNNQLRTFGAPAVNADRGSLASSTVRGNSLTAGPGAPGVRLWEADGIRVTGNDVTVAAATGIRLQGGSSCQIDSNHVVTTADSSALGAGSGGVHLLGAPGGAPCTRNRVRDNVIHGFVQSVFDDTTASSASYNLIEDNVLASVVRRKGSGYTGVIDGNRDESTHAQVNPTTV